MEFSIVESKKPDHKTAVYLDKDNDIFFAVNSALSEPDECEGFFVYTQNHSNGQSVYKASQNISMMQPIRITKIEVELL